MTISKDLREAVLQAAMQGNLTEQLPTDSSVDDLLASIAAEKEELIKQKEIKKEKPLAPISENEIPFDIPENWRWIKLPQVSISDLGKTLNKGKDKGNFHKYLCSINVYWDGIDLSELKEAKFTEQELIKYKLEKGDLLICEGGDVGRSAIWESEETMYYQNALHRVRFFKNVNPYYFLLSLRFYKTSGVLDDYSKGMTIKHLVQNSLNSIPFPFPPIEEQQRIVDKVEELMAKIDEMEKTEQALESIKSAFPDDMKAAILQAAMQGKLTEQLPTDSSVDELLASIAAEKEELIKQKKIKKEKPLAPISEDEIPFDIPESWRWVKLGNVFNVIMGQSPSGNDILPSSYDGLEFHQGKIHFGKDYLQKSSTVCNTANKIAPANSVLLCVRAPIGTANITDREIGIGRGLCSVSTNQNMSEKFVLFWLRAFESDFIKKGTGSTFKAITADVVLNQLLPIPPIEEQQRIVEKLDKLLPLCERLKER